MIHLGDRVAALVDGELDHGARERALAHISLCADCRRAVETERATKAALGTPSIPDPAEEFLARLRALAEPGEPLRPHANHLRTAPPPGRHPRRRRRAGNGGASVRRPGAARLRSTLVGVAGVAAALLGAAFLLGGPVASGGPTVRPSVERFAAEHAVTTGEVALSDGAVGAAAASMVATGERPSASAPLAPYRGRPAQPVANVDARHRALLGRYLMARSRRIGSARAAASVVDVVSPAGLGRAVGVAR